LTSTITVLIDSGGNLSAVEHVGETMFFLFPYSRNRYLGIHHTVELINREKEYVYTYSVREGWEQDDFWFDVVSAFEERESFSFIEDLADTIKKDLEAGMKHDNSARLLVHSPVEDLQDIESYLKSRGFISENVPVSQWSDL